MMDSDEEFDAYIYAIVDAKTDEVVYVGKTITSTDPVRDGTRFVEHTRDDEGMPWHTEFASYPDDGTAKNWPFRPRNLWTLKGVTRLEIAVAEQWAYEKYGGLNYELKNKQLPLRASTFIKYKNSDTYRPHLLGMPPGWCPKSR